VTKQAMEAGTGLDAQWCPEANRADPPTSSGKRWQRPRSATAARSHSSEVGSDALPATVIEVRGRAILQ